MQLRVALCQFDMGWEDIPGNLAKAGRMIGSAEAGLVVLPEMFATGFVLDPRRVAEPMDGRIVTWMREYACRTGRALTGSAIIRDDGRYFNRQLFVRPTGEVTVYDKRHLFSIGGEGGLFTAGTERVVVEYGGLRLLLLVCYDLRFPVWSRCRNDYDAIVYSASWPESRREVWRTLLRARAIENQAYVIGVNRVGVDPSARYTGDSVIVDFMGRTAADAGDRETVIEATLDREALERFRTKFPAWRDADPFTLG